MNEKSTSLVTSNYGLVIFIARKYAVNYQDMDDLVQAGSMGLIKAATSYDQSRNISFATYAVICIQNEVWQELKRKNKYQDDIPLDAPIRNQKDDTRVHVADTIADERQDFEKKGELTEYLETVLRHVMNTLSSRERYVLLCRAGGITQDELAEQLQVSQSFTSRIEKKSIKKLKRFVNFKEVTGPYHVFVKESMIEIIFNGTEEQMNEVMRKIDFRESVPKFTINYDGGKLKIKVPGDPESMPFVAKLLNIIEN